MIPHINYDVVLFCDMGVLTDPSQQERIGSGLIGWFGPFSVDFASSSRFSVGVLWVLRLPPTVQRHAG